MSKIEKLHTKCWQKLLNVAVHSIFILIAAVNTTSTAAICTFEYFIRFNTIAQKPALQYGNRCREKAQKNHCNHHGRFSTKLTYDRVWMYTNPDHPGCQPLMSHLCAGIPHTFPIVARCYGRPSAHQLSVTCADQQYVDMRKFNDICACCHVVNVQGKQA